MELNEALKYINYEKIGNKSQMEEAYSTMFREMFNVDVRNKDGTYKCMYSILSEASKKFIKNK